MIEEKYNIEYYDNKHCYRINLVEREYNLENTSPVLFVIDGKEVDEKSWGRLLERVSNYLINKHSPDADFLLNIQLDWSKQQVFTKNRQVSAHLGPLVNDLYINTNHTSTHMCWLLLDILKVFNEKLETIKLLIRKLPGTEEEEVQEHYNSLSKNMFFEFLKTSKRFDEIKSKDIFIGIKKLDIILKEHFPSYGSFLSFESKGEFSVIKSRFLRKINIMNLNENNKKSIKYILDLLTTYYQNIYESNFFKT